MFFGKKVGDFNKKGSEGLVFTGLEIPRDYIDKKEDNEAPISEEEAALFAEGEVIAILEIPALDIRYPVV